MPRATETRGGALARLTAAGVLIPSGAAGVYGRSATFERVRAAVDGTISAVLAGDGFEHLAFPPVMPREELERIGYLESFPHLAGSVFAFDGDEDGAAEQARLAAEHADWSVFQHQTDLVLVPAACYPVYPHAAARGPLEPDGALFDLGGSYVFRREPSDDPMRLQMFHQRELVRVGSPEAVADWRETWAARAVELVRMLGLDAETEVASDPFFGRSGRLLARSQRAQALKYELTVSVPPDGSSAAVASFNYHLEHFTSLYGITLADGGPVHTACVGFGLERLTLALFLTHGLDPDVWPDEIRSALRLADRQ